MSVSSVKKGLTEKAPIIELLPNYFAIQRSAMLAFNMKMTHRVDLSSLDDPCARELNDWREKVRANNLTDQSAESCLSDLLSYHERVALAEYRAQHKQQALGESVQFKWHDTFDTKSAMTRSVNVMTSSDWALERAALLFNIAAAQSYAATKEDRTTAEGTRQAAKLFQEAAGSLDAVREITTSAPWLERRTSDLSNEFLEGLSTLMLAQAQKCFYEKALLASMKDATIALLAAECAALYEKVSFQLNQRSLSQAYRDLAKEWLGVIEWNRRSFDGVQHLYAATACEERTEYGSQVSRLLFATQRCSEAAELCRHADSALQTQFQKARALAQERLAEAQRHNDTVYFDKVPEYASLPKLERKAMAKPIRIQQLDVAQPEPAPATLLSEAAAAAAMAELNVSPGGQESRTEEPPPPSFEDAMSAGVQELVQMGFEQETAETALGKANGSVREAAEILLESKK